MKFFFERNQNKQFHQNIKTLKMSRLQNLTVAGREFPIETDTKQFDSNANVEKPFQ